MEFRDDLHEASCNQRAKKRRYAERLQHAEGARGMPTPASAPSRAQPRAMRSIYSTHDAVDLLNGRVQFVAHSALCALIAEFLNHLASIRDGIVSWNGAGFGDGTECGRVCCGERVWSWKCLGIDRIDERLDVLGALTRASSSGCPLFDLFEDGGKRGGPTGGRAEHCRDGVQSLRSTEPHGGSLAVARGLARARTHRESKTVLWPKLVDLLSVWGSRLPSWSIAGVRKSMAVGRDR